MLKAGTVNIVNNSNNGKWVILIVAIIEIAITSSIYYMPTSKPNGLRTSSYINSWKSYEIEKYSCFIGGIRLGVSYLSSKLLWDFPSMFLATWSYVWIVIDLDPLGSTSGKRPCLACLSWIWPQSHQSLALYSCILILAHCWFLMNLG